MCYVVLLAVLCCAVLCCAVLCCAVLCCAVLCCAVLCCALLWLHSLKRHQSITSNISPRAPLLALSLTIIWNGNVQTIASHNGWNGYNIKILKICQWTHAFNSFKWLSLPCLPSSSSSACHMPIIAMAPPLSPPPPPPTHPGNRSKGQGHHFGHRIFKKLSWIFSHWPSSLIHCSILFCYFFLGRWEERGKKRVDYVVIFF